MFSSQSNSLVYVCSVLCLDVLKQASCNEWISMLIWIYLFCLDYITLELKLGNTLITKIISRLSHYAISTQYSGMSPFSTLNVRVFPALQKTMFSCLDKMSKRKFSGYLKCVLLCAINAQNDILSSPRCLTVCTRISRLKSMVKILLQPIWMLYTCTN